MHNIEKFVSFPALPSNRCPLNTPLTEQVVHVPYILKTNGGQGEQKAQVHSNLRGNHSTSSAMYIGVKLDAAVLIVILLGTPGTHASTTLEVPTKCFKHVRQSTVLLVP
jgi:hypothetical protein